jgi:hypothetical protein
MRKWFLIILLAVLAAGCIKPVQQLGCCMRENATSATNPGCVLYNTTTFLPTNDFFDGCTGPGQDCTVGCNETAGNCNVSFRVPNPDPLGSGYVSEYHLIPICTEDQIQQCVNPNCTAMVCGDFKFKPRASPGFQTADDAKGDVPPDEDEGAALNFYKAQCRFLPMDAKLRQIMKNSKSQINVFRMGVGNSFDEFDQYRYYFPMSDKYCNVNPPILPGEDRIDRYMNYIQWDDSAAMAATYDPEDIEGNCFDEGDVPGPFNFAETSDERTSMIYTTSVTYDPVVPDQNNYKFAHHGRLDYWSEFVDSSGGYYVYDNAFVHEGGIHKKIDEGYYRRELARAHAGTTYDVDGTGTTRAPFECDIASSECYSGTCDTRVYSRSVLLEEGGVQLGADEVVADCNTAADASGKSFVYCAPTVDVDIQEGQVPDRDYAGVDMRPVEILTMYNVPVKFETLAESEDALDGYWDNFEDYIEVEKHGRTREDREAVPSDIYFYYTERQYCDDYTYITDENKHDEVLCSFLQNSGTPPPAGGAHFFGILNDDEIVYDGKTVIGYSLANDDEIDDMYLVQNCEMEEGVDYDTISIVNMYDSDLDSLRAAFKPYFRKKLEEIKAPGFNDGCGKYLNSMDAVFSAMPWFVTYKKGIIDPGFLSHDDYEPLGYHISNVPAQEIRAKNIYSETMQTTPGTSSCELRRSSLWWWWWDVTFYYDVALAKQITLFYATEGGDSALIGSCEVDETTMQPTTKTYGWCEPCTTSTLAYQYITAADRVYMPGYTANIDSPVGTYLENICVSQHKGEWAGFLDYRVSDNVSCFHPKITDVGEYKESIGAIGSPRTTPEATVLKERLGNYMKSGILPIINMEHDSNWVMDNPDAEEDTQILWWTIEHGSEDYFAEYDFERTFANMGASIVIVDEIDSVPDIDKVNRITERAQIVRENCFGCLTSVIVDDVDDIDDFRDMITPLMNDARGQFSIDIISMTYHVSDHSELTNGTQVAEDLEEYGRVSLKTPGPGRGKPVLIMGFNVESSDSTWNSGNGYEDLFNGIVLNQDELIRSGVIGVVYSPAREASGGEGIVSVSGGVGIKMDKFCALQGAMQRMTETPPTALFTKVLAADNATCIPCTSIDLIQEGGCSRECDNGVECIKPAGISTSDWTTAVSVFEPALQDVYKCPENTIVNPCDVCNQSSGTVECEIRYMNGTVRPLTVDMSDLDSEIYLDVIGAIPKPDRCCLQDQSGVNYSFYKTSFGTSITKPVVYPRSGDENTDCGVGDTSNIGQLTGFCNRENIPLKEYDITCEIT